MSFFILSGSFGVIYALAASFGDPLAEIRLSREPNVEYLLLNATRSLRLNEPIPERFLGWYGDVIGSIFSGDFTLGIALNGRPVSEGLWTNVAPTFLLVSTSITLSLFCGAVLGVVVAMKRFGFREPIISLFSFIGYVTPVFWIGHLAKQYIVVFANDRTNLLLNVSQIFALLAGSGLFLVSAIFSFLSHYSFQDKGARRRFAFSLIIALPLMSVVGILLPTDSDYGILFGVGVSSVVGWVLFWGLFGLGLPKRIWFGFRFGIAWFVTLFLQKLFLTFPDYLRKEEIGGRPFPSFGYESVWFEPPEFWILQLDRVLHLILPVFAITFTTVAIYYQVTKNAAIEALDSDYVRLARSKGISPIEVLVRHVFRNCYLSLINTFVPNYLYLMNSVIIIELVFGWQGLGIFLLDSLYNFDLNRLMGGIFVSGVATFIGMVGSDIISSRVDPRIREFD